MVNAKQPTQQTHHMETKAFAIQDWIKEEKLVIASINTKYIIQQTIPPNPWAG